MKIRQKINFSRAITFFPHESEARTWPRHNRKDESSGYSGNLIGYSGFCASAVFALLGGTLAKYTTGSGGSNPDNSLGLSGVAWEPVQ